MTDIEPPALYIGTEPQNVRNLFCVDELFNMFMMYLCFMFCRLVCMYIFANYMYIAFQRTTVKIIADNNCPLEASFTKILIWSNSQFETHANSVQCMCPGMRNTRGMIVI